MGLAELDPILTSASSLGQVVLLDFSVSWCGPCRMLAPILVQLATENRGRVVVVKMDCEKTAANQALAASASISAYPTIKIYSRGQVVETLRGANPAALRQALANHLALLPVNQNLALSLAQALSKVKAGCSFEQFLVASKTLAAYVVNIVNNPTEPKYRKINLSNQSFQSRLGRLPGGKECLLQIGFQERTEAMEPVLVLDQVPEQLKSVLNLLQQAIRDAERTNSGGGAVAPKNPSSPAPAAQLARVLEESMHVGAGSSNRNQAAAPFSVSQQQQQPLKVLITPEKLARALAKIMREAGLGSTSR
jgi:thioredoxin 1